MSVLALALKRLEELSHGTVPKECPNGTPPAQPDLKCPNGDVPKHCPSGTRAGQRDTWDSWDVWDSWDTG